MRTSLWWAPLRSGHMKGRDWSHICPPQGVWRYAYPMRHLILVVLMAAAPYVHTTMYGVTRHIPSSRKVFTYRRYPRRPRMSEHVKWKALTYDIFRPLNIICINLLVSCRVPLDRSAPKMTILRPFMERVMALRSLHSQLVAQVCAHRKRALQIKRNAKNDPELAKISGEVQDFCVCEMK